MEQGACIDCPIRGFFANREYECEFDHYSDECIEEAYKIAFYYKDKSDEIDNHVKHGKWIDKGNAAGLFCSECDFKVRYRDERRFKYCPNCGAKMERSD